MINYRQAPPADQAALRKIWEKFYRQAPLADQAALRQVWEEAGLGTFPESGD